MSAVLCILRREDFLVMPFLENRALIVFLCSQQAFCAIARVLTFFAESSASA